MKRSEIRAELLEQHRQIRHLIYAALLELPQTSVDAAGVETVELIALMRDHIDREEAAFLGEDVLGDDLVSPHCTDG